MQTLQFRDLLFCMQLFLLFQPLCCALQPFFKKLLPLFWSFTLVFCLVLSLSSLAFLGNYIYLFSCPKSKKKSLSRLYADLCCFRIEFNISIWFSWFQNWNILFCFLGMGVLYEVLIYMMSLTFQEDLIIPVLFCCMGLNIYY